MAKPTTVATEVARFRQSIEEMLRSRVRDAIEIVLEFPRARPEGTVVLRHATVITMAGSGTAGMEAAIGDEAQPGLFYLPGHAL